MPQGLGGMGTGSDTRLYNPRSEADKLYAAEDDAEYRYGEGDYDDSERRRQKKQDERDARKRKLAGIHHLKIRHKREDKPVVADNKDQETAAISQLTAPSGSGGMMSDVSSGAKTGMGSAMGGPPPLLGPQGVYGVATGEPMDNAWSELLKDITGRFPGEEEETVIPNVWDPETDESYQPSIAMANTPEIRSRIAELASKKFGKPPQKYQNVPLRIGEPPFVPDLSIGGGEGEHISGLVGREKMPVQPTGQPHAIRDLTEGEKDWNVLSDREKNYHDSLLNFLERRGEKVPIPQYSIGTHLPPKLRAQLREERGRPPLDDWDRRQQQHDYDERLRDEKLFQDNPEIFNNSKPMDNAWSEILKIGERRQVDPTEGWRRKPFMPSPGGRKPWTATGRRGKVKSRQLSPRHRVSATRGGYMETPLSVHMSHLGVKTKQPMKLFPEKYRQYFAQQAKRRMMDQMSLPHSTHAPYGERTQAGVGKLTGQLPGQAAAARVPSVQRLQKPRMPSLRSVRSPPMSQMRTPQMSSLPRPRVMKAHGRFAGMDYLHFSQLRNLLRDAKRLLEEKDKQRKALGPVKVHQAGHRSGKTTRPQGPTEDLHNEPENWGANPIGISVGRGSGRVG